MLSSRNVVCVMSEQWPHEETIVISTNVARQGVVGHNVHLVLVVSVIASIIAVGVV